MIAAFSSKSELYIALTQVNTDGDIFRLYLSWLAEQLDKEQPSWRQDSVIQLDNASYHSSNDTLAHIKMLNIPVIFSGPQSYDASPAELLFAYFKNQDINLQNLATGKK